MNTPTLAARALQTKRDTDAANDRAKAAERAALIRDWTARGTRYLASTLGITTDQLALDTVAVLPTHELARPAQLTLTASADRLHFQVRVTMLGQPSMKVLRTDGEWVTFETLYGLGGLIEAGRVIPEDSQPKNSEEAWS